VSAHNDSRLREQILPEDDVCSGNAAAHHDPYRERRDGEPRTQENDIANQGEDGLQPAPSQCSRHLRPCRRMARRGESHFTAPEEGRLEGGAIIGLVSLALRVGRCGRECLQRYLGDLRMRLGIG